MPGVLIIGGTRFLGLEITRLLAAGSHGPVYVLNRGLTSASASLPDRVQRIVCDVGNIPDLVSGVISLEPAIIIDTILNDAALAKLLPSLGGWVKRFIHTGSIGVYGATDYLPARESDVPRPAFPSFRQKLAQDEVVTENVRDHGLPATILRMSNIYGRGDVPLDLWGGRNPKFFRMLISGEEILLPGDGSPLLHTGHVSDLASAYVKCLEKPASIGEVYNIGGDRSITLSNWLQVIATAMGVKPRSKWTPIAKARRILVGGELTSEQGLSFLMNHMSVDISKARAELGYQPEVDLEDGMSENIRWMRDRGIIE